MAVSAAYTRFVYRVWDEIRFRTGWEPWYLASNEIASYCPSCTIGTVRLRFLNHPKPAFVIASPGAICSQGCTEQDVGVAIFSS